MRLEEIQSTQARRVFSDMLDRVAFLETQYRISRHEKHLARLVPEKLMAALETLVEADNALAETLELLLNEDLRDEVEQAVNEARAGNRVELESILTDD